MDDKTQAQVDQIVEDEVRRGFKVLELPKDLQAIMLADREVDAALPEIKRVRFTKLTPRKRRFINETVVKRYHADLQNKELLSMEQLRRLNIERGEWSDVLEKRISELQEITGELAREVIASGHNESDLLYQLNNLFERYKTLLADENSKVAAEARSECIMRFSRWYLYDPEEQAQFDALYGTYRVDDDHTFLMTSVPSMEALDVISEVEELRDTLTSLKKLLKLRRELLELQVKQAKMFGDCVEQRRDQTEEYARVYYTTERLDDTNKGSPLTKTFEELWAMPEEVVSWFLTECYFFLNGIPDSVRPYLEQMGFLVAPRERDSSTGSDTPSDESPVEQASKPDSLPPTEMLVDSLV